MPQPGTRFGRRRCERVLPVARPCRRPDAYWDLQGSGDARGLADGLLGSVEDSEAFRRATDISAEDLEGLSVGDMATTLVRRTVRSGWRLLLLVDEAEEFLTVARADASVLPRLRKVFQKGPEVRTVLTATKRLARVDERTDFDTSPFMQGFIPPLYLTPLADDEARALLARGRFAADETALIMERTANHPFLVQLIASRLFESRDLAATLDQVAADEMVSNFFSVDFQTLDADERAVLEEVARHSGRDRVALAKAVGRAEEARRALALRPADDGIPRGRRRRLPPGQLVLRAVAEAGGGRAGQRGAAVSGSTAGPR